MKPRICVFLRAKRRFLLSTILLDEGVEMVKGRMRSLSVVLSYEVDRFG